MLDFRNRFGRSPDIATKEEDKDLLNDIKNEIFELYEVDPTKSKLDKNVFDVIFDQVVPVCAVLGGVISQEVIKAVSHKEVPINNVFLFDPFTYDGKEETVGV